MQQWRILKKKGVINEFEKQNNHNSKFYNNEVYQKGISAI